MSKRKLQSTVVQPGAAVDCECWRTTAGSLGSLRQTTLSLPPPPPGFVQVKVCCVGLNFADVFACKGLYSATPKGEFTPGLEFSGRIVAIGNPRMSSAKRLKASSIRNNTMLLVGDRVMGVTRFGAYATHVNVDARQVRRIPSRWSFAQGAAFLTQAMTAYYALKELGSVKQGMNVLVHSAAGGVGLQALSILRAMDLDAKVIATIGSSHKTSVLTNAPHHLQPEQIIVRTDPSQFSVQLDDALAFVGGPQSTDPPSSSSSSSSPGATLSDDLDVPQKPGIDISLDSLLGGYFQPAFDRLNPGGRVVVFGAGSMTTHSDRPNYVKLAWRYLNRPTLDPLSMISQNRSVMAFNLIWLWDRMDEMTSLLAELMSLKLPPPLVGHTFPFDKAVEALRFFQEGQSVGKVVLMVENEHSEDEEEEKEVEDMEQESKQ